MTTGATTAPLSPGELALQLQALLGQHTVLAADMMRGRLRDDPDLAQAANSALGKNTDAMGKLVAGAFGTEAAAQFTPLWSNHVTALFNYARGLADGDTAVQNEAKVVITRFETDLAEFFVAAAQGRLPRSAAVAAVTVHIDHLIGQADAYAAEDWAKADQIYRQGFAHAFELGKGLAATLLPPDAAKVLGTPSWRLRSALTQLLGEHVELVVGAMRAGVTDADDFDAAAAAVNGNTADLAGAIDTLFGSAAARSFQSLWADHIDLLVSYAAAIAKGDDVQRSTIGGQAEQLREPAGRVPQHRHRRQDRRRGPGEGAAVPRHDAAPAGGRLRGEGLRDRARRGVHDVPGDVRAGPAAGRRVRAEGGVPAPGGSGGHRPRRDGVGRRRSLTCRPAPGGRPSPPARSLLVALAGCTGSPAAGSPGPSSATPVRRLLPGGGQLQVGPDVRRGRGAGPAAHPGRRRGHLGGEARPGRGPDASRCPAARSWPAGSPAGRGRDSPDRR